MLTKFPLGGNFLTTTQPVGVLSEPNLTGKRKYRAIIPARHPVLGKGSEGETARSAREVYSQDTSSPKDCDLIVGLENVVSPGHLITLLL